MWHADNVIESVIIKSPYRYTYYYRAQKVKASEKALSVIRIAHNLRRRDIGLEADSPVHKVRPC